MGTIFALTGVIAAITLMFSGALVDRFGAYIGADVAFVTLIIGGVVMGVTDSVIFFAIGALLFAVGEAFYGSAQGVLLIDFVENKYRGEILGVDRIFDNAFSALAMGGSGILMLMLSAQYTWLLFVLYLALAYICAFIYRRIHRLSPVLEHE
jgi:MFS family permease